MEKLKLEGLGLELLSTDEEMSLSGGWTIVNSYVLWNNIVDGAKRFGDGVANGVKNALDNCAC